MDDNSNSSRGKVVTHTNLMSLRISTEASVKLLTESVPLTLDLLYFFVCLPKGIKRTHLVQLFDA